MERRVFYLITYPPHLMNLVCSIYTLRKHWDGPVDVLAWPESYELAKTICSDPVLNANAIEWKPNYRGKNDTFVDKTRLVQDHYDDQTVLFLDADTTIHGDLEVLFWNAEQCGYAIPQFCDWLSSRRNIAGRLRSLEEFPEIDKSLIDIVIDQKLPSINNGVFAARPDSPVLPLWHKWTYAARTTFIPDEKVIHLLMAKFLPLHKFSVLLHGACNCSPIYQPKELPDEKVIVRHFHGDSNYRIDKSQKGVSLWMSVYHECMRNNVGQIASWRKEVHNKYLDTLEKEKAWQL